MKVNNRLMRSQPDYIVAVVSKPSRWEPESVEDVPPSGKIYSLEYAASYDEALDDLVRSNELALRHKLDRWVIIRCPESFL